MLLLLTKISVGQDLLLRFCLEITNASGDNNLEKSSSSADAVDVDIAIHHRACTPCMLTKKALFCCLY